MAEAYKKVGWQDLPSQQTPLSAKNLGQMDDGIKENRDLLIEALNRLDSMPSKLSELESDSMNRTVTDTEKQAWNNKSDFSGSYNDLADKPTIPTVPVQSVNGKTGNVKLSATDIDYSNKAYLDSAHVQGAIEELAEMCEGIPSKTSQLTNDSKYVTDNELNAKGYAESGNNESWVFTLADGSTVTKRVVIVPAGEPT